MSDKMVSVIDIAKQVGKQKQTVFKVLKRLGIETQKIQGSNSRGQRVAYITKEESQLVISEILQKLQTNNSTEEIVLPEYGVFYVIQLEPEHDSGRFKVGFATNINERIRQHRCSAPFAKLLKKWPCRSLWEKTAIDCVCNGCEKLHTEVFRTDSIDKVIEKCDIFFSIMPDLSNDQK